MKRISALSLVLLTFPSVVPAAELCLVPSAANNRNITVDCFDNGVPNGQIGYRTEGTPTCNDVGACEFLSRFTWTISSSSTNPLDNSGPLPAGASLYLWLYCDGTSSNSGMAAAEFDLAGTELSVVDFVPMNGFLNVGTDVSLLIVGPSGCPHGPVVAGRIDVEAPVSVGPVTWGRIKSVYR